MINLKDLEMKPHPKFEGVKIGYILTKEKRPELSITVLEILPGVEIPLYIHEKEIDTVFYFRRFCKSFLNKTWRRVEE